MATMMGAVGANTVVMMGAVSRGAVSTGAMAGAVANGAGCNGAVVVREPIGAMGATGAMAVNVPPVGSGAGPLGAGSALLLPITASPRLAVVTRVPNVKAGMAVATTMGAAAVGPTKFTWRGSSGFSCVPAPILPVPTKRRW